MCTVLFVDLVGFTPFTENHDAEDVREMLSQYFDRARTVIERYGGVVEKFIGDAVMAIWGTPIAVEGDAERAVRAGLELIESVVQLGEVVGAPELRARAGVVTGDVAVTVGAIGEGIAGDTVNTAARVQSIAAPHSVWVDAVTERITKAAIGYIDVGDHALKGKSERVHLWAATRVLSTIGGAQRVDGLEAPMVGRDVELRTIKDLFHSGVDRRVARLVVVSGPAGSGKSRLGWEFEKYIDGLSQTVLWHRGRCLSYGDGVAFWALAEMVRQRLGIAEEDDPDQAAAKVSAGLEVLVSNPAERAYIEARLAPLLGVTVDPDTDQAWPRQELFAGWRLFLERLAAQDPVLLLLEDAHHADAGLLDFLDHLTDWSRGVPIVIIVFARPELHDAAPSWGTGRNRSTITLDPLDAPAMDTLVNGLVPGMPPRTRNVLTNQAQGIPLYAVETIRSLIDRDIVIPRDGVYRLVGDITDLTVPDTLRGLLAARFDALPPDLHSLLADAAVLGTTFPAEALIAVSGRPQPHVEQALSELVRREILDVSADPLSPQRGFYGFSQNLLRQVVYDTLSKRDRRTRHLAVAAHLRATFSNDGDEVVEVIAQHYVDALIATAAGDDPGPLRAEAIRTLQRGAERAARSGAPRRSAAHLAEAAALVAGGVDETPPAAAAELWERAARAANAGGLADEAVAYGTRAVELFRDAGDERAAARAGVTVGAALITATRYRSARDQLATAVERVRIPVDRDTVLALCELARADGFLGHVDNAMNLAREAVELAQELGVDRELMAWSFTTQGHACINVNRYEEAAAAFEHAIRLAERNRDTTAQLLPLINLGDLLLTSDPTQAEARTRRAQEIARLIGDTAGLGVAVCNLAGALVWQGRWDDAENVLADAATDGLEEDISVAQAWAIVAGLRGDFDTLERLRAYLETGDIDSPQDTMYADAIEVIKANTAGDHARAIAISQDALSRLEQVAARSETVVWCWTLAFRSAFELSDHAARAELIAMLDAHPDGHWPPLLLAERTLYRAITERSTDGYRAAIAALRATGSTFHLAHGLLDHARSLANSDGAAAHACIDEATSINDALRAPALARRLATFALVAATAVGRGAV